MEEQKNNIPESSPKVAPIEIDALVKKIAGSQNPPPGNSTTPQVPREDSNKAPLDNLKNILSSIDTNTPQKENIKTIKVRYVQPDAAKEKSANTPAVPKDPSSAEYIPRERVESALNAVLIRSYHTFEKQEVVEVLQKLLKEARRIAPPPANPATTGREIDSAAVQQLEELIKGRKISNPGTIKTPSL